ncbi:unnamed protein product [Rotaria magnacalcarata]|uniref:Reverse transcriptase domain-containing protein n=1 Tax=Rotaria magnacalcarata TaxID=392030 RepID=A0A819UM01_9BILA|nr:unnamed protein product [Rotaria magnacalcarata]
MTIGYFVELTYIFEENGEYLILINGTISYVEPTFINQPALLVNQITLPPYSQTLVDITCRIYNDKDLTFEPQPNHLSNCILIPHTLLNIRNHEAKVLMINVNDRPQTLSKNTRIGTLSRHSTDSPNRKNICDRCNEYFLSGNDLQIHLRTECYSNQIRKHIVESTKHIDNEKHRLAVQGILWRNKILFDPTPSIINIPPQTAIKTGDHPPIYSKQYSSSYEDQEIKVQKIQKLLERGQIEESTSPWSSSIVLVKKKDKTMIFCIDYRRLNAITIKNTFPLPRIEEILDQLSDAAYYTKFDFKSAYIDDIIIYSKTFDEHLSHLNEICGILKNARFRLNPEKCEVARTQTGYLGHQIDNGEIRPSSYNISGLLNTKIPQSPDEACKFMKAAEYYRKFIQNLSQIAEPLRKFVSTTRTQRKKGQKTMITLTQDEINAFNQLKHHLTTDLVLRLPNINPSPPVLEAPRGF